MENCRAHLRLDVVAKHGQVGLAETFRPVILRSNENRNAVDECTSGCDDLFHIPFGGFLRTHRQEVNHHIGFGFLEQAGDVRRWAGRFLNDF